MEPAPRDEEAERLWGRQWRLAQLNLGFAGGWLVFAQLWWFVDDATWQRPVFTALGLGLVIAAASNLRQQQRNRRRRQEREDPG